MHSLINGFKSLFSHCFLVHPLNDKIFAFIVKALELLYTLQKRISCTCNMHIYNIHKFLAKEILIILERVKYICFLFLYCIAAM